MDGISMFWIVVYIISALMFFGTAGVIAILGMGDLRDLLRRTEKR